VKEARLRRGANIVTIIHDAGIRYMKKFYNADYLKSKGIRFELRDKYEPNDLSFVK
jgi:hypothetical protein